MGLFGRKKKTTVVKCSKCNRDLELIPSIFDAFKGGVIISDQKGSSVSNFKQWLGWVCVNCQMVFCTKCESPKRDQPMSSFCCPNCGQTLAAATSESLKQIGLI